MQFERLIIFSILSVLLSTTSLQAQEFLSRFTGFSPNKIAYVTLTTGEELTGYVKGAKWKKGLMESIKFIKEKEDKKQEILATDIAFLYVQPSGLESALVGIDLMLNANKWGDLEADYIKEGYLYFEQVTAKVGRKTRTVLMQLLNPHFNGEIRVYNDPFAKETGGLGVGGLKVTGGYEKSYYIVKGDAMGYRVYKKDFKKEAFNDLLAGCDAVVVEKKPDWKELARYIAAYNTSCGK